jgi:ubiquinone/menaquinone biosynthesis C-methylase UbiE
MRAVARCPQMVTTRATRGRVLTGIRARYYDIGNALFGVPLVTRRHVSLIRMKDGDSLLDVGCGTGAVLRRIQRAFGEGTSLLGIDPSPDILGVAAQKLRACPNARVAPGIGEGLSFPDNSFDWVVSCLTTHHLPLDAKRLMIGECHRVLRPAGRLLVSDFGTPLNWIGGMLAFIWRRHAHTDENLSGVVYELAKDQGFTDLSVIVQGGIIQHLMAAKA